MRRIRLAHHEIRCRVRLTDPLLKMFEWNILQIVEKYEAGTLPVPIVLEDGDEFLIVDGNHRIRVAFDRGWALNLDVVESASDLADLISRDVRSDLPADLEAACVALRLAAAKHDGQWEYDYSF